jgi:hypothetical protein
LPVFSMIEKSTCLSVSVADLLCPGHRRPCWAELSRTCQWVCQCSPPHSEPQCGCSKGSPPEDLTGHQNNFVIQGSFITF